MFEWRLRRISDPRRATVRIVRQNWQGGLTGVLMAWTWIGAWLLIARTWPELAGSLAVVGQFLSLGLLAGVGGAYFTQLQNEALTDSLTGLANRRAFQQQLTRALSVAERYDEPVTLVLIDLDGFKSVNDTRGHPEGDRLLQQVGEIMTSITRQGDVAARIGGDEFALIVPRTPKQHVHHLIKRLTEDIRSHCGIHLSVGVAAYPGDGNTPDKLITAADRSLYRQKAR